MKAYYVWLNLIAVWHGIKCYLYIESVGDDHSSTFNCSCSILMLQIFVLMISVDVTMQKFFLRCSSTLIPGQLHSGGIRIIQQSVLWHPVGAR